MAGRGRAQPLAARPARRHALAGAAAIALLALPPVRRAVEAGMATHMLLQFPALIAAGALLASACPASLRRSVAHWNVLGIAGLCASASVLALSMIPRLLDLALVDARVEAAKWAALLLCGVALRLSWRPAGAVVQGFFLGNVLPMTGVVGVLYQDATVRLCNSYRLDEQALVGEALVWIAVAAAAAWLVQAAVRSIRAERDGLRGRAST